jgi:hypothetical protein
MSLLDKLTHRHQEQPAVENANNASDADQEAWDKFAVSADQTKRPDELTVGNPQDVRDVVASREQAKVDARQAQDIGAVAVNSAESAPNPSDGQPNPPAETPAA